MISSFSVGKITQEPTQSYIPAYEVGGIGVAVVTTRID